MNEELSCSGTNGTMAFGKQSLPAKERETPPLRPPQTPLLSPRRSLPLLMEKNSVEGGRSLKKRLFSYLIAAEENIRDRWVLVQYPT